MIVKPDIYVLIFKSVYSLLYTILYKLFLNMFVFIMCLNLNSRTFMPIAYFYITFLRRSLFFSL